MKTSKSISVLTVFLLFFVATVSRADDGKFIETMQRHIETVYSSQNIEEIQSAINTFDRIGEAEKTKWEPFYYSAFGYVMMANLEKDPAMKDTYLDQALKGVEKAKTVQPGESEIVALEGFVHMIRVTVDPASRGHQYSGLAFQAFGKAVAMNPENPRALCLLAQMQYGTAQFFGSPTTEACATVTKSLEKFDSYKSANALAPQWGRKMAEGLKSRCN
jgi:hypothetical protein